MGTSSTPRVVKSAARTLDILELLLAHPKGLTLSQMGERLEIPLSSLHDLARTLSLKGFVVREEPSLVYRLGPRIVELAAQYHADHDIISLADPVMAAIRDQVQETTSLTVLENDSIVFIHKQPAKGIVRVVNPVGTRLLAHATGSGKVMLAQLPQEEIDRLYPEEKLEKPTPATIDSKATLKKVLAEVRRKGYAYDAEESQIGVWAVAACIRDRRGAPVAALSIVGPLFRIREKQYQEWHHLVVDGANQVSRMLGHRPMNGQGPLL